MKSSYGTNMVCFIGHLDVALLFRLSLCCTSVAVRFVFASVPGASNKLIE